MTLGPDALAVETNSVQRANAMRRRVEAACGGLLRDRKRRQERQAELFAAMQRGDAGDRAGPPPPPPEVAAALREHKQRYYEAWLDESIPALGGKTPRQAACVADRRTDLELLLKEMENREARIPEGERADFSPIRAQLGL